LDEGTDNYIKTDNNFNKMLFILHRIKVNLSLIIIVEAGIGKTSLMIKLSLILNNGEKLLKIFNIHPSITD